MREDIIKALTKALDTTEEMFFISKSGVNYEWVSEMKYTEEWVSAIEYYLDEIKKNIRESKEGEDAINDILGEHDINLN